MDDILKINKSLADLEVELTVFRDVSRRMSEARQASLDDRASAERIRLASDDLVAKTADLISQIRKADLPSMASFLQNEIHGARAEARELSESIRAEVSRTHSSTRDEVSSGFANVNQRHSDDFAQLSSKYSDQASDLSKRLDELRVALLDAGRAHDTLLSRLMSEQSSHLNSRLDSLNAALTKQGARTMYLQILTIIVMLVILYLAVRA